MMPYSLRPIGDAEARLGEHLTPEDLNHPVTGPMGSGLKLQARRKHGSHFPVEISLKEMETWRAGTSVRSN